MFLEIIKAKYLDDYKISLLFNNGVSKTVNLEYVRTTDYTDHDNSV